MRTRELLTISLPPDFLKDLEEAAKEEHRTKSELAREALRRYLAQRAFRELRQYAQRKAKTQGKRYTEREITRIVKEYRREQAGKTRSK
jgi:CopG family transcriptional regulator/antitoxin EndoAI